jgi:hypothetical protein
MVDIKSNQPKGLVMHQGLYIDIRIMNAAPKAKAESGAVS